MRRATKWAAGAAAAVVPILASASPAAAVGAVDRDSASVSFTSTSGGTVSCSIFASHDVDDNGQLGAGLSLEGGAPCQGFLVIDMRYVDDHGDAASVRSSTRQSSELTVIVHDAGSRAVTTDYLVAFENCASNCEHTLQTKTK